MGGGGWWWVVGDGEWWGWDHTVSHGNPAHGNSTKQKLTRWQDITFCKFRHPTVYEPAHIQSLVLDF